MLETISPSLICMDLCNLERDVATLERSGFAMLHVDIVDGYFSPSMPMGLDVIRQLRKKTALPFDAHLMAMDNAYFLDQLLDIGVSSLCFHVETERHAAKKLSMIRDRGVKAGLALSPGTSLATLDYALELCDFVLLMTINPGYAGYGSESAYPFMPRKIADLKERIIRCNSETRIEIDGRVSLESMRVWRDAGAEYFVAGTACLFSGAATLEENIAAFKRRLANQL